MVGRRDGPPPPVLNFLDRYGGYQVVALIVERLSLSEAVERSLDMLTWSEWSKGKQRQGLARVFHCRLRIIIRPAGEAGGSNDMAAVLEKRPVVRLAEDSAVLDWTTDPHKLETAALTHAPKCNLATFIWHAAKFARERFWEYDARKNNCQHFISGVLKSWNLLTDELRQWIEQPLEHILAHPRTIKWTNIASEVGRRTDILVHGLE